MNRKSLSFRFGIIMFCLIILNQLESCRKKDEVGQVDFTLDLTDPKYSQLNSTGGFVVVNNVIIARTQSGSLVAVSSLCTYDGSTLTFDAFSDAFICPSDQSKFDLSGNPESGYLAKQPLISYHVQLYGNSSLHVYS